MEIGWNETPAGRPAARTACLLDDTGASGRRAETRRARHSSQGAALAQWRPLAEYLSSALGREVELAICDHAELNAIAAQRTVDVVLTNPSHAILLQQTSGLSTPLATLITQEGDQELTALGGTIFTRADSAGISSLGDLAGRRIAVVGLQSFGGYQVQALELAEAGVPLPRGDRLIVTGLPQDGAVDAVLAGRADAGFVRAGILEALAREGRLDPARVRTIHRQELPAYPYASSTRLYPEWPVAVMPQVDGELAARLTVALLSLPHRSPELLPREVHGFGIPANYDGVENLLRRLRLPPFNFVPEVAVADLWHRYAQWIVAIGTLLLLLSGTTVGLVLMYRRSRHDEERFRTVADYNYDWEYWRGPDQRFLYLSPACERITGYSRAEFLADPELEDRIIHPEDRQLLQDHLAGYRDATDHTTDFRIIRKDGGIRWIAHGCRPIFGKNGEFRGRRVSNRDITERKQAEAALQHLNRELRAISSCNQALMRAEDERTLLDNICGIICGEAGYRMAWVGYAEHDDAKRINPIACGGVEHGYLATASITWADTEHGRGPSGTAIRTGRSSCIQDFATEPQAAPWREGALQRGFRSSIALPLKAGSETFGVLNIYSEEPQAFTPDEMRLLEELAADLAFGITVLRARGDLKRAEADVRRLNQELEHRVAMRTAQLEAANKELEEFSYSISHDMRSPLRAIDGFSKILLDEHGDRLDDEARRLQMAIRRNAQQMGRLIDDILDFLNVRNRKMVLAQIDMAALVGRSMAGLEAAAADGCGAQLKLMPMPPAWGDMNLIGDVLRNLLSNALKFRFPERETVIEVGGESGPSQNTHYVKDNGVGFDMRYADKLFKVFERVHPTGQYEGTAIGLAIVKRIVERHGGSVSAESRCGKGATFRFSLPNRAAGDGSSGS